MSTPGLLRVAPILLLGLVYAAPAAAVPPVDQARAQALFDDGRRLMGEGRYEEACPKLAESERLDHGVGTLLNLGDCYERSGRTASAWAQFRAAEAAAHAEGQPDRAFIARDRAALLLPQLVRIVIKPAPSDIERVSLTRDGAPVPRALWGMPIAVDPGLHEIVATAPGAEPFRQVIDVPTRRAAPITTELPPLAPARAKPAESSARGRGMRIAGVVVGGIGVVGAAVGSALGVFAIQQNGASEIHCQGDRCDREGVALRDSALRAGTASTVTFVAAGVALAGGAILYFTAPRGGPQPSAQVGLNGLGGASLTLGAAW